MTGARPEGGPVAETASDVVVAELMELVDRHFAARPRPVFRPGIDAVPIGSAVYDADEVKHVLTSLLSGWISMGAETAAFERAFAAYVGCRAAIAVNSGSSANLVALSALLDAGRLRRGDEVVAPAATFTTVLSPILQVGLRPVLVDVEEDTYNIAPSAVAAALGPRVRAVLVVHTLGQAADMARIAELVHPHELVLFEDCCEAHGTRFRGRVVGSFGHIATSSFYVAHNMTTGEGGMILTDHPDLEESARSLREFGRLRDRSALPYSYNDGVLIDYDERYVFERLGYNVRMTDIAASFGIEQLRKLDAMNERRIATAAYYRERLRLHAEFLRLPTVLADTVHTYYAYPIVVRNGSPFTRAELGRFLEARRIETRALFGGSLIDQPAYRGQPIRVVGDLPASRLLRDDLLFIGCHPRIGADQRAYVCDTIDEFIAHVRRHNRPPTG